jgi:zinc finger protein CreA/MIG
MASARLLPPLISDPPPSDDSRQNLSRPYRCPQCDKAFHRLEHMTRHIRTHTGEKPHACKYLDCTKRFSRSDELVRHSRIHRPKSRRSNKTYQGAAAAAAAGLQDESSALATIMPSPSKTASQSPPTSKSGSPNVSPPHSYSNYVSTTPQGGFARNTGERADAFNINLLAIVASQVERDDHPNTQFRPSRLPPSQPPFSHYRSAYSHNGSHFPSLSQYAVVHPRRDHTHHEFCCSSG